MRYTAIYFKNDMPDWKRKKDPILIRIVFRPISFFAASLCANLGITANIVSVFSTLIAIVACSMFLLNSYIYHIIGSFLIFFWLLLDCVDGNLARSMRQQPFGEFVDAMSSYILVGFMGVCIAFNVYAHGGLIVKVGNVWIIFLGALASSCDSLMRLIYQKYKSTALELENRGIIPKEHDVRTEHQSVGNIRVRIELELGIAGFLPILILICTLTRTLDMVIYYMIFYYGSSFVVITIMYIYKALRYLNISMK